MLIYTHTQLYVVHLHLKSIQYEKKNNNNLCLKLVF